MLIDGLPEPVAEIVPTLLLVLKDCMITFCPEELAIVTVPLAPLALIVPEL